MTKFVEQQIGSAQDKIRRALPAAARLSPEAKRSILRRYAAAIAPNFVPWMAAAAVCSRSLEARFAAGENIFLEIQDDHPRLLNDFVAACGCEPDGRDFKAVVPAVDRVKSEVAKMSGLFITSLMALLENASADFIPWLAEISRSLGGEDFRYTDVHGIADAEHAKQFNWALEKEALLFDNAEQHIQRSLDIAVEFAFAALSLEKK